MTAPGDDFTKCGSCGHWTVTNQPHTCEPDLGEICNATDIDNCAEHGWAAQAHRNSPAEDT